MALEEVGWEECYKWIDWVVGGWLADDFIRSFVRSFVRYQQKEVDPLISCPTFKFRPCESPSITNQLMNDHTESIDDLQRQFGTGQLGALGSRGGE